MQTPQQDDLIKNFTKTDLTLNETDELKIDLCCGVRKKEGFTGIDILDLPDVDVIADLNNEFPFEDDSADMVRAHDAIEHLKDPIHIMNEIWRVCKPKALVDIVVPSTDGRGAFQDPTHVSYWNVNSFMYYTIENPEYLELCKTYGFKGAFSIQSIKDEGLSEFVQPYGMGGVCLIEIKLIVEKS